MVVCAIVLQFLLYKQEETATGISAAGYAFVAAGTYYIYKEWRQMSKGKKVLYGILILLAVITGWVSCFLHLSGVITTVLFMLLNQRDMKKQYYVREQIQ